MFDRELLHVAYASGGRDLEMVLYESVDPNPAYGLVPRHVTFVFRYCVELSVYSTLNSMAWSHALEERAGEDHDASRCSPGTPWVQRFEVLYPGATIVEDSSKASTWSERLGVHFHEVAIEGNVRRVSVVFLDLDVHEVGDGYTPYRVIHEGPVERDAASTKIPLPRAEGAT